MPKRTKTLHDPFVGFAVVAIILLFFVRQVIGAISAANEVAVVFAGLCFPLYATLVGLILWKWIDWKKA